MTGRIRDMTRGNPAQLIFRFALPLMAGNVCQQLYTITDTAVVGQFVGVEALAALGASDWLNWLVLSAVSGYTHGFSIWLSQRFGAGDQADMRRAAAMSILLSAAIAILFLLVSQICLEPVLALLNTPRDILPDAILYLRIFFMGIPIVTAYNLYAGFLRALGDGKTPLVAMIVASVVNIGLDLWFVVGFGWGIAGAAAATLIAQAVSFLYCLRVFRRLPAFKLKREDFRPHAYTLRRLLALGTPVALQNSVISVGGLAVQYVVNGFGFIFLAGFTATNKLYGLIELAAVSYGYAVSSYVGQNLGAKMGERIRAGVRAATWMAVITAVAIGVCMLVSGRGILGLFVSAGAADAPRVLDIAYTYLAVMSALLPILYLLHVYRSALQGMGDTVVPMVSGLVELIMRVSAALVLPLFMGQSGVYVAEVAAWTGAAALLMAAYFRKRGRLPATLPAAISSNN